jgi:hypothetical protein
MQAADDVEEEMSLDFERKIPTLPRRMQRLQNETEMEGDDDDYNDAGDVYFSHSLCDGNFFGSDKSW